MTEWVESSQAVNRHTQETEEQALTSDSLGRPRPESDTFCHLKRNKETNVRMLKMSGRENREKSFRFVLKALSDSLRRALKCSSERSG